MNDQASIPINRQNTVEEPYRKKAIDYVRKCIEIHDAHRRGIGYGRSGSYTGIPSWSEDEQAWKGRKQGELRSLAEKLGITPEREVQIKREIEQELQDNNVSVQDSEE